MINVGIIGLGFMGRMHFGCYKNNAQACLVAVSDSDSSKLSGEASGGGNIAGAENALDMTGIRPYTNYEELINDPDVQLVDICLPTPLHADLTIKALHAGKDVFCEKPMAMSLEDCYRMEEAAAQTGRKLTIGHVIRYWPQYLKAHELMQSGDYGKVLYARLHRSSGAPSWSRWMMDGSQSGGAIVDMHIHDADTALWWFGQPDSIHAEGLMWSGLPAFVDATWRYNDGPLVHLHGAWDKNGGPFKMKYQIVMENGTLSWDSSQGDAVHLYAKDKVQEFVVTDANAYQNEIDDFIACVSQDRPVTRVTPQSSRMALEVVLEELRQIKSEGHRVLGTHHV